MLNVVLRTSQILTYIRKQVYVFAFSALSNFCAT